MGQRLTNNNKTKDGDSSEVYYLIDSVRVNKDGSVKVSVRYYLNKIARDDNYNNTTELLQADGIRNIYYFTGKSVLYNVTNAYSDVAECQKNGGNTVQSDDSGSWVNV